jgi:hypothetical protein
MLELNDEAFVPVAFVVEVVKPEDDELTVG